MFEQRIRFNKSLARVYLTPSASRLASANIDALDPAAQPGAYVPEAAMQAATVSTDFEQQRIAIEQVLDSLTEAVQEIEQRREQSLSELQQVAVELAVAIASRLIYEKVEANDFAVEKLVEQVVCRLEPQTAVTIRLHPEDLTLLERRLEGKLTRWSNQEKIRFVPDGSLGRGDCRADTESFGILSKIELQLSEIRQHLLETLDYAQTERRQAPAGDQGLRRFPDRRDTA